MMGAGIRLLRHATWWLLARREELSVDAAVALLREGLRGLTQDIADCIAGSWRERHDAILHNCAAAGAPQAVARRDAQLPALDGALDIVELATARRLPVAAAGRAYFGLGAGLGLDWLRDRVDALQVDGSWQAIARTELRSGLQHTHRQLVEKALAAQARGSADARVAAWLAVAAPQLTRWRQMLDDLRAGATDFATLSVAAETLRKLL